MLPPRSKFLSAGDARPLTAEADILTFDLDLLANGASTELAIRYDRTGAPPADAKQPSLRFPTLLQVSGAGYDPNQANNGHFARAVEGAVPEKATSAAPGPLALPGRVVVAKVLSEKDLASLIDLRIRDSAILVRIQKTGVAAEVDDTALTITVPGTEHNLWPLKGAVNAPLVLQAVAGDFTVEVLVQSVEKAEPGTALPGRASTTAFHSGTLVIWQDDKNFVRLDRTDMNKAGRGITSSYLHVFQDGERVVELGELVKDTQTHLRLQRRGDQLTAAYSQDGGEAWQSFPVQKIKLANKVQAGASALNCTSSPCEVRFEDIQLKN